MNQVCTRFNLICLYPTCSDLTFTNLTQSSPTGPQPPYPDPTWPDLTCPDPTCSYLTCLTLSWSKVKRILAKLIILSENKLIASSIISAFLNIDSFSNIIMHGSKYESIIIIKKYILLQKGIKIFSWNLNIPFQKTHLKI